MIQGKPIISSSQPQSPLDALAALEQWRVKEEDTRKHSARWSLSQSPLQVWVEPYPDTGILRDFAIPEMVLAAMRQWEAATEGAIAFQLLRAPALDGEHPADILICWQDETTLSRDYEVGHTNRQVQGKRLTHATITLITNPLIDAHLNAKQCQQRLMTTILHETGHALGLEHSDDSRDVMYYRGWKHANLSGNDIQRIRNLYELKG